MGDFWPSLISRFALVWEGGSQLKITVTFLVVAAILAAPVALVQPAQAASTFTALVPSFDGHKVPVTVYLADASPAPTLLWGHGWSGSRADSANDGAFFSSHGFNVVAMDFRGHGEARSSSNARVHDLDYEIRDVSAVIDFLAAQSWSLKSTGADPVLGAIGGSYGGAYQLLTAALDPRLDAIAPDMTWNDLPYALAPNGALKSGWIDFLYGSGTARANLSLDIHEGLIYAMTTNQLPDGSVPGVPDLVSSFERSSPKNLVVSVPTLLTQGSTDTLFNLNQAVANANQIAATGAEVKLVTHLGGHLLHSEALASTPFPGVGLQAPPKLSPCGALNDVRLAWYDYQLNGAPDTLPALALGYDDGSCRTSESFEFGEMVKASFPDQTIFVPALASAEVYAGGQKWSENGFILPLYHDWAINDIAGIPRLHARADVIGGPATLYFGLLAWNTTTNDIRLLSSQVTPIRLAAGATSAPIDMDLGGVVAKLVPGERLSLQVSAWNGQYVHNSERSPHTVVLNGLSVDVPRYS